MRAATVHVTAIALFLFAWLAPMAAGQVFSNTTPIAVPDLGSSTGAGTPYPSSIVVSGAPTSISYVSVTLNDFSHSFVSDVNVLLVSPAGQKILLMANTNDGGRALSSTLTFVPDGTATLPPGAVDVVSGLYACSVYGAAESRSLPPPAPGQPYATSLAPLIGTDPNGTWSLFVWDDYLLADHGAIAGGWSIRFSDAAGRAFTYQGVLAANGAPVIGSATVRFTLCDDSTSPTSVAGIAPPITRPFSGIADGLISTTLDFGPVTDTQRAFWLNVEVESPPGSGFVSLSPRQPITPTPQARSALRAVLADSATTATNAVNAINAVNATTAAQLAPGRPRIRSDAGASVNSPGIWFASPVTAPVDRAFVGMRDDSNIGFFNAGWGLLLHSNGNVAIGNGTGAAPTQRLVVSGNVLANNVAVPSSGRFKHNVAPMSDALDRLLKLDGVTFDWNAEFAKERPGREHDIGFVAEDVAKVFPEVVFYDADGKVTGMDYSRLTAVAVQAIKQQQAKFDAELARRDADNAELKARLAAIEAALSRLAEQNNQK